MLLGQRRQRILRLLAHGEQFALEGAFATDIRTPADDCLAEHRHLGDDGFAKPGGIGRNIAPAKQDLSFDPQETLELFDHDGACLFVARQETIGDCIMAGLG